MGKLKRKDPNQVFHDHTCKWCGKTIVRTYQCYWEWQQLKGCSPRCGRLYNINKCSEAEFVQEIITKRCMSKKCNKPLHQREKESRANWKKRLFCDKSCAASGNANKVKKPTVTPEEKVHLKRYIPGTPEFKAIAQLYGG